ncbi:hypothetical protein CGUA_02225 [Corynebacterium guangdongense]|uniref:DUF3592 domain-containing protein n=2 Tax=Corynebacterium guangdongense TaxID=1783348 RepID=A0ABU1ZVS8_9CORY|nr:hypothetical protein [Corynebacterium guangdongense]WJZ17045.1 hypothetical protein CGUA_02225 [Corynebacterium guangdongense]
MNLLAYLRGLDEELIRRRLRQLVLALWVTAMIGSAALLGGAWLNDRTIHSDPGRSMATVTEASWLRTTVEYQDSEGRYHSPATGLLYPSGLGPGQQVWVTYAKDEPGLVTVEGRRWTLSIIPVLSIAAVSSFLAVVAWWGVAKLGHRKIGRTDTDS